MIRNRVRFRFRKEGDLRLISHRDLVRTFERLFRRAGLELSMSEGFHPHPRMTFPLALSVGIVGLDEVMEVELAEQPTSEELYERLASRVPPGLAIERIECLPVGTPKVRIRRVEYSLSLPSSLASDVAPRIDRLLAAEECWVERGASRKPVNVRPDVEQLELLDDTLRFVLRVRPQGGAQGRDVLRALELQDVETRGLRLYRSRVDLVE